MSGKVAGGWRRLSTAVGGHRALVVESEKGKLLSCDLVSSTKPREDWPRQDEAATLEIDVHFSNLNYKDGMILKGQRGVVPAFPIVPGIDLAGVVSSAMEDKDLQAAEPFLDDDLREGLNFREGDEVLVTGNKIGQHFDGGFSTFAAVKRGWAIKRPEGLSLEQCMAVGTAGHTAMMCIHHLETAGAVRPEKGDVLVTGAAGGLGSIAVALLARAGYRVIASTRRTEQFGDYLASLGAADVIGAVTSERALDKQLWAGVVDSVGGSTLSAAVAQTKYQGAVASTGVAGGGDVSTTVYPFILRGVRLLGVDSTLPWNVSGYDPDPATWVEHRRERVTLWKRLATDLTPELIAKIHSATVGLTDLSEQADLILGGKLFGRVVVDTRRP